VLRPEVDRHKCVGSGNCLFWAPATFDLDDEGVAVVIDPDGDDGDRIRVAVDGCPSKALALTLSDSAAPGADPVATTAVATPAVGESVIGEQAVGEPAVGERAEEDHGHRPVR
jgi:ferredoxin